MRKKKRGEVGECVYCGKVGPITMDHVPPRLLFPDPKPALITVPSCLKCNNSASKDDEYFRLVVSLREDVGGQADMSGVLASVIRSAQKANAPGLRATINNLIQPKARFSEAGLILGMHPAVTTDLVRLGRVASRIVTGLFFHETKKRLGASHMAQACLREGFDEAEFVRGLNVIVRSFNPQPKTGGSVFKYWVGFPKPEDPNFSVWLLLFYDQVLFLCQTVQREVGMATERKWEIAKSVKRPRHYSPIVAR